MELLALLDSPVQTMHETLFVDSVAYMTQETKIGVIRSFMGEELTLQEKLTVVRKRCHGHKQQKTIAREICCNQSTVSRVLQQFLSSDEIQKSCLW